MVEQGIEWIGNVDNGAVGQVGAGELAQKDSCQLGNLGTCSKRLQPINHLLWFVLLFVFVSMFVYPISVQVHFW